MDRQTITDTAALIQRSGDEVNAGKMAELAGKLAGDELFIAFCGHFSAGKSSLINHLCGHALLPASPIPTSANVVTIRNGPSEVKVIHKQQSSEFSQIQTISLEELPAYCRDGEGIESIEIHYPIPLLGTNVSLLDTPGIDSTDGAHRLSTESALHLADVVFYVMDYNHVQSEMNFAFAKKLQEWGKPLYLIVNQIDKHQQHELSFAAYRDGVEQAFANWHIQPAGIVYLTLKQPQHPENEINKLLWLMQQLIERSAALRKQSVAHSSQQLLDEHMKVVEAEHEAEKATYREELDGNESIAEAIQIQHAKKAERETIQAQPQSLFNDWKKDMTSIIENANITPAATRDLAHHYLQSRKPGFKLGLFSRSSLIVKEINHRLDIFHLDFAEKVKAHLDWHLSDFVKKIAVGLGGASAVPTHELMEKIEQLGVVPTAAWLAEQVNTGAVFSNEYTLTYSQQLASAMKALFRARCLAVLELMLQLSVEQVRLQTEQLDEQLEQLEQQLGTFRKLEGLELLEKQYLQKLHDQLGTEELNEVVLLPDPKKYIVSFISNEDRADEAWQSVFVPTTEPERHVPSAIEEETMLAGDIQINGLHGLADPNNRSRLHETARRLRSAAELIRDIASMKSIRRSMLEKAERLENSRFTIALFGAFSAGKSSFANALLGEKIVPVSPNPTTAAINTIVPPTDEWPHGNVKVKMKTASYMLEEVRYSLQVLGLNGGDWTASIRLIATLSPDQISVGGKPHYTFLKAVEIGWEEMEPLMGTELRIGMDGFANYVADETKSCFVELIELYYANPLTNQGIVFVDTPGADSINARHTGVAFNYIKNADAIIFVTYYNHAFSQADREFLLQLGRVKDSFEMDKMFFIVNAADLAADAEELNSVIEHVEVNLIKHGIRKSRIYPVSSQMAVEGKLHHNMRQVEQSGMFRFENDFIRFTFQELSEMAVHSARLELERSIKLLEEWIEGAQEGEQQRKQKRVHLELTYEEVANKIASAQAELGQKELTKEIAELLYYVKQRVMYRYGELFTLAFNPSTIREDGNERQQTMVWAWEELLRLLSYDLSHEVLASTLRVEQYMNRSAHKVLHAHASFIALHLPSYQQGTFESDSYESPEIAETINSLDVEGKWLASFYKNGKHFFEGEGKQKLRNELEVKVNAIIASYVDHHTALLETSYTKQYTEQRIRHQENLLQSLAEHVAGLRDALDMKVNVEQLVVQREQLKQLL